MTTMTPPLMLEPSLDVDKISYEIFSMLESKFLFGYDEPKIISTGNVVSPATSPTPRSRDAGHVRVLSIDGGGRPADGLLAAAALARLETSLRRLSGEPDASVADFFDVAAGSGAGGVLAAMLFTKVPGDQRRLTAGDALQIFADNHRRDFAFGGGHRRKGWWRRRSGDVLRQLFGDATMRDAVKPLLVPCYDAATAAPFLFSRADAVEMDGCDFAIADVCAATCTDRTVEIESVDGRRRLTALGGGVVLGNPASSAVTHVLHNKHEFPLVAGVEDIVVVSIGSTIAESSLADARSKTSPAELVRIAGAGAADMVDQAVSMAFGQNRTSNYVRIQANGIGAGNCTPKPTKDIRKILGVIDHIFAQRNVESVMFKGKKLSDETNGEKLERFARELIKENERRKKSPILNVVIKQVMTPRTSSTTFTTTTTTSPSH